MNQRQEGYSYYVDRYGYPRWSTPDGCNVSVHQLTAIAAGKSPYDVFSDDKVIHHKNTHKFDNREGNLELLTNSAHSSLHYTTIEENIIITPEGCQELGNLYNSSKTIEELSSSFGVSKSCVWEHLAGECSHHNDNKTKGYKGPRNGQWRRFDIFYAEYVEKGKSMKQLSKEWGCSLATVSKWKKRHDIENDNR